MVRLGGLALARVGGCRIGANRLEGLLGGARSCISSSCLVCDLSSSQGLWLVTMGVHQGQHHPQLREAHNLLLRGMSRLLEDPITVTGLHFECFQFAKISSTLK
jgi:hypothetical protein